MSVRTRVTGLAAVCVGTTVALVSLAGFFTVRSSLYDQLDTTLLQRADSLRSTLASAAQLGGIPEGFFSAADIRVGLLDGNGQYAAGGDLAMGPDELAVARGERPQSLRTDRVRDLRVAAVPAGPPGTALVVAQKLSGTRTTLDRLGLVFTLVGGAGVLLAAAAGTAVAQAGLRPVQRLTEATERIARTGELQPIAISGDDELARLTASFNSMLSALAESQERQRRLVADAGHELRTPLTSLRTNLELLAASDRPDAPSLSDQDRKEISADVRAQVEELSTLVGDIVELAREDAPQVVHEPVELPEVVERALARAARRAPGVHFEVHLAPWSLLGDANALERAVLNLLDNAAKWSPAAATVTVALAPTGRGTATVEVADTGPGIAEADLPYIFERFYRSSDARTLPGSGLGLAIVAQVAARHGGTVQASRRPSGGTLMTLELPGRPST
ncbi:MAG: HAMP domain-containing histidine kinase [Pseudonocardiales bacterium]|nr:HAMP domain-containing histidine kinase [Pseudonocardiales bacterium]MBV9030111.1 HAMP domain-containing histidine kinase [Pseudonocardiales bacterium]MBW0009542.1 HAMP domain-containing histidine kinase [Pseudonocardiales bacterium]